MSMCSLETAVNSVEWKRHSCFDICEMFKCCFEHFLSVYFEFSSIFFFVQRTCGNLSSDLILCARIFLSHVDDIKNKLFKCNI